MILLSEEIGFVGERRDDVNQVLVPEAAQRPSPSRSTRWVRRRRHPWANSIVEKEEEEEEEDKLS